MDNQKIRLAIGKCMEVIKQEKKIQKVFFTKFQEVYMNDSLVEVHVGKFIVRYEYCNNNPYITISTPIKKGKEQGWMIQRYDSVTVKKIEDETHYLMDGFPIK